MWVLWKTELLLRFHPNILQIGYIMEFVKRSSFTNNAKDSQIVDNQNKNDPGYQKMSDNFEKSIAFSAACDLILKASSALWVHRALVASKRLEKTSN